MPMDERETAPGCAGGGLLESVSAMALVAGEPARLVDRNRAFEAVFGYWEVGQPADDALAGEDWEPVRSALRRAVGANTASLVEFPFLSAKHTDEEPWMVRCMPTVWGGGPAALLLVSPRSQSADRRAGSTFEAESLVRRYEALLSAIPQTVWLMSPKGEVTGLVGTFGSTAGGLWHAGEGDEWMAAVHPKDREWFEREWAATARGEAVLDAVVRVRRKAAPDSKFRHVRIVAVPVIHRGVVTEWIGTVTDTEDLWRARMRERLLARMAALPAARDPSEAFRIIAAAVVPDLVDAFVVFYHSPEQTRQAFLLGRRDTSDTARTALAPGLPPLPPIPADFELGPVAERAITDRYPALLLFPPGDPPPEQMSGTSFEWLREASATSLFIVPVVVDNRTVALAAAASCRGNPPPDKADLQLLEDVLHHVSGPLRLSMELQAARDTSLALQQSFLAALPDIDDAAIEAAYQPADTAAEVGGDWYDVTTMADKTLALTIGDIAGHDLAAATAMARVNSILKGLACDGGPAACPARTLAHLDGITQALQITPLATVVHALLRPQFDHSWEATISNAGHPPPLLIPADGRPHYLRLGESPDPPLGAGTRTRRNAWHQRLRSGDTLLLYTDGLVEVPGKDLDAGLDRLLQRTDQLRAQDLSLADIVSELLTLATDRHDDVAVIAFRPDRPQH
ncbi:Stage II sporulation protein E (SpoIIE) [Streptomyces sp. DfronAA-171]|nr:Stage II sporulation protein E (SpoIIE) [Streptomyces sp. DfronAA-171]